MSAEPQELIQPARRPLLIGESNPYGSDPRYALYPYPERSAGGRLCNVILGMSAGQYLRAFDRANLCAGKWVTGEARQAAVDLTVKLHGTPVILLGSKVCGAFGIPFEPFTQVSASLVSRGGTPYKVQAVILPHPSGLCRLWGEPGAVERARAALREAGAL